MNFTPSSIRVHLLNAPRLEVGGAPVEINRRKALALLAYLALTRQAHLRDTLATLLWPGSGQALARANLRHTLVVLKQTIGNHHLEIARDRVALNLAPTFWVDVLHFQALLRSCQAHGHAIGDVCAACLPLLLEAVAVHAEQFMAGFTLDDSPAFDDWQRSQQQQLNQALRDALDRLVCYFTQSGDTKRALEYAQRSLALDTLDEAAHRRLMRLYAWSGQQGLALRQFEQCAAILSQELAIAPSAESVRLMQEIQAGRLVADDNHAHTDTEPLVHYEVEGVWRPAQAPHYNLPARLPALIGRDHDLRALQEMLQRREVSLITLVGPGGVGKTQLALQLAPRLREHFADGVTFVSLASLREAEQVLAVLAQTWNLPHQDNQPLQARVESYLRAKQMLLILDNFEHLMAVAPLLSSLLAQCVRLRMVVTSRELLNLQGEYVYTVSPLALPRPGEALSNDTVAASAAVQLFTQRAQAIAPGFVLDETNAADIAAICAYLDGLPLALELVAARIRLLPPRTLRQRLLQSAPSSFELLQGGARDAPARHRTIRDTIAWSYALLTATEQQLFHLLAVFVGGCTLNAVEHVSQLAGVADNGSVLDNLASLVNKSLIQQAVQPDGESRFSMLELIREYALEQTQANDDHAVAIRAHAETYAAFAETAVAALSGPDHLAWVARLNADHNNCRAALHWALAQQDTDLAIRFGGALWRYWLDRGNYREGEQLLTAILHLPGAASRTPGRAKLLTGLGAIQRAQGKLSEARACLEEAITICRALGDVHGLASALEIICEGCYLELGLTQVHQLYGEAIALYDQAGDRIAAARVRQQLGFDHYHNGDYTAAQAIFEATLALYKAQRHEAGIGDTLCNLGRALFQQQRFAEAKRRFTASLSKAQACGDQPLIATALYFLGRVAYYQAEYTEAKSLFEASLRIYRTVGAKPMEIAFPLAFLSDIALGEGDLPTAFSLLRESIALVFPEQNLYAVSLILPHYAGLAFTHGRYRHAVQFVAAGYSLYHSFKLHLSANDQEAFEGPLEIARRSLSAQEFAQAWATGEQMTMADAVTLALAEYSNPPSIARA